MRLLRLVPLVGICLGTGCNRNDGERLALIGRMLTQKVEALVPDRNPLQGPFGRHGPTAESLEDRVRVRIKDDRYLSTVPIEVMVEGTGVRLRGRVEDEALRRRAVELAESTVGVEKVIDEMSSR